MCMADCLFLFRPHLQAEIRFSGDVTLRREAIPSGTASEFAVLGQVNADGAGGNLSVVSHVPLVSCRCRVIMLHSHRMLPPPGPPVVDRSVLDAGSGSTVDGDISIGSQFSSTVRFLLPCLSTCSSLTSSFQRMVSPFVGDSFSYPCPVAWKSRCGGGSLYLCVLGGEEGLCQGVVVSVVPTRVLLCGPEMSTHRSDMFVLLPFLHCFVIQKKCCTQTRCVSVAPIFSSVVWSRKCARSGSHVLIEHTFVSWGKFQCFLVLSLGWYGDLL